MHNYASMTTRLKHHIRTKWAKLDHADLLGHNLLQWRCLQIKYMCFPVDMILIEMAQRNRFTFCLSLYLDQTLAQRNGSAKS